MDNRNLPSAPKKRTGGSHSSVSGTNADRHMPAFSAPSVPSAPRRKRSDPVDFADKYDIEPAANTEPFDPNESEQEVMGTADYEAIAAAETVRTPEPEPQSEPDPKPEPEPTPQPEPEPTPQPEPQPEMRRSVNITKRTERPTRPEPEADFFGKASAQPEADFFVAPATPVTELPERQVREKPQKKKRVNTRARVIIWIILFFIIANLVWITIFLANNFAFVGGKFIDRSLSTFDASDMGLSSTIGVAHMSNLKYLDLSGNDISIRDYKFLSRILPDCDIVWDVPLGEGVSVNSAVSQSDVSGAPVELNAMRKAVPYMDKVERLDLGTVDISDNDLIALEQTMAATDLVWDASFCGAKVKNDAETLNVAEYGCTDLEQLADELRSFDHLTRVDLSGCGFTDEQLDAFADAHRGAHIAWQTTIGTQTVYTDSTELTFTAADAITDISALRHFYRLNTLRIEDAQISDLSPLTDISTLRILTLDRCGITDISPLAPLTDLIYLELNGNRISDLSAVSGMQKLEQLHLNKNDISDISPISGLASLKTLNLQNNNIRSTSGLGNLPVIENLSMRYNHLEDPSDVDSLCALTSLVMLDLQQNDFKLSEEQEITAKFEELIPNCTVYIWK